MATDNISSFYKAIESINFNKVYWFGVVDLWEMKNIRKVVGCLHALARYVGTLGDYVKIKDLSKTKQEFKEKRNQWNKKILEELDAKEDPNKKGQIELFPVVDEPVVEEEEEAELANPDECTVEGEGSKTGVAGVQSSFIIVARDTIGNELEVGGEKFSVHLFHKTQKDVKIVAEVKDLENGKYEVKYTPKISGDYSMDIYLIDDLGEFSDEEGKEGKEKKRWPRWSHANKRLSYESFNYIK